MNNNDNSISIRISYNGTLKGIICDISMTIKDIILKYFKEYLKVECNISEFTLKVNGKKCPFEDTIKIYKNEIDNKSIFELNHNDNEDSDNDDYDIDDIEICEGNIANESARLFEMEINIKFFKIDKNNFNKNYDSDLHGLLNLCLLKEIANCKDFNQIKNLPQHISNIMSILKKGNINYNNVGMGILEVLNKIKGGNIINFSKYVDELISQNEINQYLISNLNDSKNEIQYIKNCLGKYIEYSKRFEQEFERAKRDSVFEYSVIASAIIEREGIDIFENNRQNCPNREDRVLFHGTSYDSISKILPDLFRRSEVSAQHGKGVYFTQDLDSCWIYGSEEKNKNNGIYNRRNLDIPKVGDYFSLIASAIYYDKKGFKRVYDSKYTPKKNEINFAYAGMNSLETIKGNPDKKKFFGTEFVIYDLDQICPFMSFKLKRDEYCIIWRDNNFSPNPVYNNEFDAIFKKFLKERMDYINKMAKFNIYPCQTSEEALNLIRRKKYNKIILISNIGSDYGGKKFVEEARQIIGNDVVVLFNAYSINHLRWVKDFKNAFFSNQPKFYEQYLECFYDKKEEECKKAIKNLKKEIEEHYKVKFNFDEKFLDYPYTKNAKIKKLNDITF